MIKQKNKSFIRLAVLALFLCMSFLAAYTYAWFFDSATVTGTLTFGKIDMNVATVTLTGTNVMPGGNIFGSGANDLTVTKESTSQDYYLAVKVEISMLAKADAHYPSGVTAETALTAMNDSELRTAIMSKLVLGSNSTFFKASSTTGKTNGYVCVTESNGTTAKAFTATGSAIVIDVSEMTVPSTCTQVYASGNLNVPIQDQFTFTMTLNIVAVQSANVTTTIDGILTASGLFA